MGRPKNTGKYGEPTQVIRIPTSLIGELKKILSGNKETTLNRLGKIILIEKEKQNVCTEKNTPKNPS